eukprot:671713-Amphidinium_carterae.1
MLNLHEKDCENLRLGLASPWLSAAVLRTAGGGESPPVPLGVETSMSALSSAEGDNALYMVAR